MSAYTRNECISLACGCRPTIRIKPDGRLLPLCERAPKRCKTHPAIPWAEVLDFSTGAQWWLGGLPPMPAFAHLVAPPVVVAPTPEPRPVKVPRAPVPSPQLLVAWGRA